MELGRVRASLGSYPPVNKKKKKWRASWYITRTVALYVEGREEIAGRALASLDLYISHGSSTNHQMAAEE